LPWEAGVSITPLPEPDKIVYLQGLIDDAIAKGAKVVNAAEGGGQVFGLIMKPAIVYPVTSDMRLWHEEQFGPVVPVAQFSNMREIDNYLSTTPYGQQASIFTQNPRGVASLIDTLSTIVGRININTQCGRSPDVFPFSGRRNSALGTMSVTEGLLSFSIPTVIATKDVPLNRDVISKAIDQSNFLHMEPANK
jgi:glyceraldehyde-3-phosphate dehydrogenase (NADP+)